MGYDPSQNGNLSLDASVCDNQRDLVAVFRGIPNVKGSFATELVNRNLLFYEPAWLDPYTLLADAASEANRVARRTLPTTWISGSGRVIEASQVTEHLEVVGSDGQHVGTVDHMEGTDRIKLTKMDQAAGGEHHFLPLNWVTSADGGKIVLNKTAAEAKASWL